MDTQERAVFSAAAEHWLVRGGGVDVEIAAPGGLRTEEMILNIGPQHPSTHGVLRVVLELDGEVIRRAEPVIGYMHDWLSAFNNELGWTIAVERLAGIEVPERAQWIRTMMAEWNRLLNHLMFFGSYPLELGAMTPVFYAFIERELIQNLIESTTGARMHHSYARIGGLKDDLPLGFVKQGAVVLKQVRKRLRDFDNLIMGNEIIHARTKDIGIITPEMGIAYGVSGPTLHATGVPMDPRKDEPYEKYAEVEFDIPIGRQGDSYDRLWVLLQRMHESCKIIEQCLEKLPAGEFRAAKLPKKLSLDGEVYVRTENPLGMMGYYVVGNGKKQPYRVKMRTASFSNVSVLPALLPGTLVPDLISILGSIFFVVGDVDR
jgi:NADH-quinone oxidoreductase subunit D